MAVFSDLTDNNRFINIPSLTLKSRNRKHNEKNLPAQQKKKEKESWFSGSDADEGRAAHHQ